MRFPTRRVLRALAIPSLAIALLAPIVSRAAEIGNFCIHHYAAGISCQGTEAEITRLQPVTILEDCASGDPTTAEATFRVWYFVGPSTIYDAGLFLALNGGSALSGGMCLHDFLEPPLTTFPIYGDADTNGRPDIVNGPWWDGEPFAMPTDLCGDVQAGTEAVKTLTFRFVCTDSTSDGIVDLSVCASWHSGTMARCDGLSDATPPSSMRCKCGLVETGVPMPAGGPPAGRIAGLSLQRGLSGQLQLSWAASCSGSDTDYGVYEGTLGQFPNHHRVACTTAGATSATIQPGGGNRYYLVVPHNPQREGSYGTSTGGFERAPAVDACLPQALQNPCP